MCFSLKFSSFTTGQRRGQGQELACAHVELITIDRERTRAVAFGEIATCKFRLVRE